MDFNKKTKVVSRLENAMIGGDLIDFKHYKYNILKYHTKVWGAHKPDLENLCMVCIDPSENFVR